jgi:hypothetical protein
MLGSSRPVVWLASLLVVVSAVAVGGAQAAATRAHQAASARDAWIGAEANRLSGRSLTVTCAASGEEWARTLTAVGFPSAQADEYYGFSLIEQGEMHLSPYVCAGLRLGLPAATRRANELQVAWSVDVLVHESVHLGRFTSDEALAEACARAGLPVELHRLDHVAYGSAELRRLTAGAALFRKTMAAAYQGGVCPRL